MSPSAIFVEKHAVSVLSCSVTPRVLDATLLNKTTQEQVQIILNCILPVLSCLVQLYLFYMFIHDIIWSSNREPLAFSKDTSHLDFSHPLFVRL